MVEYAAKFRKVKKEKREILKRCSEFIAKVRKVNDKANINNNQINSTSSSKKAEDIFMYDTDIPNKDEKEQGCVDVESSITKEHDSMDNEEHGSDVGSSSCLCAPWIEAIKDKTKITGPQKQTSSCGIFNFKC